MTKRTFKHSCYFCPGPLPAGAKRKYVYPLPAKYKAGSNEGAYACSECYPTVFAELQAEGQLLKEDKSL